MNLLRLPSTLVKKFLVRIAGEKAMNHITANLEHLPPVPHSDTTTYDLSQAQRRAVMLDSQVAALIGPEYTQKLQIVREKRHGGSQ